jgi:hypothetical protein
LFVITLFITLDEDIVPKEEVIDLAREMGGTYYYIIEQESYGDKTSMFSTTAYLEIINRWRY